jgi:hypothetical protein
VNSASQKCRTGGVGGRGGKKQNCIHSTFNLLNDLAPRVFPPFSYCAESVHTGIQEQYSRRGVGQERHPVMCQAVWVAQPQPDRQYGACQA